MSVIKNDYNIRIKKRARNTVKYEVPAVIRKDKEEISFEKALMYAVILHPVIILILLLTSLILQFLGIDFKLFNKPELKPRI